MKTNNKKLQRISILHFFRGKIVSRSFIAWINFLYSITYLVIKNRWFLGIEFLAIFKETNQTGYCWCGSILLLLSILGWLEECLISRYHGNYLWWALFFICYFNITFYWLIWWIIIKKHFIYQNNYGFCNNFYFQLFLFEEFYFYHYLVRNTWVIIDSAKVFFIIFSGETWWTTW